MRWLNEFSSLKRRIGEWPMNMNERNEVRELTLAEIEAVAGAVFMSCTNGQHIKSAQLTTGGGTQSGWWGTNEAAGETA